MIVTIRKERQAGAQAAALIFGAVTLCAALLPHRERALLDLGGGTPAVFGAQAVDDVTFADAQTGYVPTGIAVGSTGSPRTAGRQRLIPGLPRAAGIPGVTAPSATPAPPQLALNNLPDVVPLGAANPGGGDLGSSTGGIGGSSGGGGPGFSGFPGGATGGSSSGGSVSNPGFDDSSSSTSTGGSTSTSSSTGGDPGGSTTSSSTSTGGGSTTSSTSSTSTSSGDPGGSTSTGGSTTSSTSSTSTSSGDPGGSTSTGSDPGGSSGMVSPVPEPSSWLMMIMGFGFVGAMLRRSRRRGRLSSATAGPRQS